MEINPLTWQDHFGLSTCSAGAIDSSIPPTALGVAVIYALAGEGEEIYLVLESRAGSLRDQCLKRLQSGKLPPTAKLTLSYKCEVLPDPTPEALQAACRQQVMLAGELRRELRPAMR